MDIKKKGMTPKIRGQEGSKVFLQQLFTEQ